MWTLKVSIVGLLFILAVCYGTANHFLLMTENVCVKLFIERRHTRGLVQLRERCQPGVLRTSSLARMTSSRQDGGGLLILHLQPLTSVSRFRIFHTDLNNGFL